MEQLFVGEGGAPGREGAGDLGLETAKVGEDGDVGGFKFQIAFQQ